MKLRWVTLRASRTTRDLSPASPRLRHVAPRCWGQQLKRLKKRWSSHTSRRETKTTKSWVLSTLCVKHVPSFAWGIQQTFLYCMLFCGREMCLAVLFLVLGSQTMLWTKISSWMQSMSQNFVKDRLSNLRKQYIENDARWTPCVVIYIHIIIYTYIYRSTYIHM